ncbi:CamS family sex pheromone protein [Philodulcilactobacillus myokoensis]|uniref:CamS family sex pheromone protein n=1 Tax=Philodulcilactobacillus myokoensis TaxID=2929573 RepID=A0A9W6ESS0_9LACO|nr:CamS family sex pheromone protein [Philodulcilactobacillus myokoensis]GLB46643.1 CamS family sex pheromone protein [Philodulcilactobacillus myokoensis]
MKKLKLILAVAFSSLLLAACGNLNGMLSGGSKSSSATTQLTGQANHGDYQSVIKNGRYLTSKSRGVNIQQNDNQFNLKSFENGLLDVSKKQFPTNKYIFQEGQYISTNEAYKWLGRKSKSNPQGLNPSGKDTKVPLYLQQLDEQDFLVQNGNSLKLKGMTVGLGINSVYYYTKEKYGSTYQMNLNDEKIKQIGKAMASQILKRLRSNSKLKNIPIVIALYKQAPDDSLVGGNFFAYSSNNGSNINSWNSINEKNYVFPIQSGSKGPNNNDQSEFTNFKNDVQSFFPNLNGVTAQAHYVDGSLSGMHISITTQFYSQTEITSFTQYLKTAAQKYLPKNIPIDISVNSSEGTESFLSRSSSSNSFTYHVFNSY